MTSTSKSRGKDAIEMQNLREFFKEIHEAYHDFSKNLKSAAKHLEASPNPFPRLVESTKEAARLANSFCQISQDCINNMKHQLEEFKILKQTSSEKQKQIRERFISDEHSECKKREKVLKEAEIQGMKLQKRFVLSPEQSPSQKLRKKIEESENDIQNAKNDFLIRQIACEFLEQFFDEQVIDAQRFHKIDSEICQIFLSNCTQIAQILIDSIGKTHFAIAERFEEFKEELSPPKEDSLGELSAIQSTNPLAFSIPSIKIPLHINEKTIGNLLSKLKEEKSNCKRTSNSLQTAKSHLSFSINEMKGKFLTFELELQYFKSAFIVEILNNSLSDFIPPFQETTTTQQFLRSPAAETPITPVKTPISSTTASNECDLSKEFSSLSCQCATSLDPFSPCKHVATPKSPKSESSKLPSQSVHSSALFSPISFRKKEPFSNEQNPFQ